MLLNRKLFLALFVLLSGSDAELAEVHDDVVLLQTTLQHDPGDGSAGDGSATLELMSYYVAVGDNDALTDELKQYRVSQKGRMHLFHMPIDSAMLRAATTQGSRRSSMSLLQRIDGQEMPDAFPEYEIPQAYVSPLDTAGEQLESSIAGEITKDRLTFLLDGLTSLPSKDEPTRSYTNLLASYDAQTFLMNNFASVGLGTCMQNFTSGGYEQANVVAVLQGTETGTITLGAHYDSRPFDGTAPGAVDNGSGVAALLAIAQAFMAAGVQPRKTIYFVGFAAEEIGLVGSDVFAKALDHAELPKGCVPTKGSQGPHSAIIMDEVGWRSPSLSAATVNMESYDWVPDIMENLAQASQTINGDSLYVVHSNYPFGSDHMSWLGRDMPAVLTIQGDDTSYPCYHQSCDNTSYIDYDLMAMITKMNAGGLLRLAGIA